MVQKYCAVVKLLAFMSSKQTLSARNGARRPEVFHDAVQAPIPLPAAVYLNAAHLQVS